MKKASSQLRQTFFPNSGHILQPHSLFNKSTTFVSVRRARLEEEVELQARAPRRQAGARRREEERERAAQGPRRQPRLRQTQEDDALGEQGG